MSSTRIRTPDDIAACAWLLAEVHAADGYPASWPADPAAWLSPPDVLAAWVAENENGVVGHVALRAATHTSGTPIWTAATSLPSDRLGEIARLYIAPGARGQGFGAALLATACDEARRQGLRPVLEVLDHDVAAITLYERTGWQRVASVSAPWSPLDDRRPLLHYYVLPHVLPH